MRLLGISRASVGVSKFAADVIPGLVPGIHLSPRSGARGYLDPGDERRDDTVGN
jgi:hypothetical protein